MSEKCYFDKAMGYCVALTVKKCKGCTFRKTENEYNEAIERSEQILNRKGLIVVEKNIDGVNCISTERI